VKSTKLFGIEETKTFKEYPTFFLYFKKIKYQETLTIGRSVIYHGENGV